MIVKIKSYKHIGAAKGLLEYALNDKSRLFDENGRSFVISHNLKGQSIPEWVAEIKANEKLRVHKRKNNNRLTQEIISFHPRDAKHITIRKLEQVAREYIRRRNPNGMYVAVPHFDKGHYHIHVIAAAIEYKTGKSLRMSRQELSDLKRGIQEWQIEKYPELSMSVVRHGRKKKARITEKEYQYKLRTGKKSDRETLQEMIQEYFTQSASQEELFAHLKAHGMEPYVRGQKSSGVVFNRKKYRLNRLGFDLSHLGIPAKERMRRKEISNTKQRESRGTQRSINSKHRRTHDR